MTVDTIETKTTSFRVRTEGQVTPGRKAAGFIITTDPPNTVEHYDKLIASLQNQFSVDDTTSVVVCIVEAPGFGFSTSTASGLPQSMDDFAELFQHLRSNHLAGDQTVVGLVVPCVLGLFARNILERLDQPKTISFLCVPQCADYNLEKTWANGVNANGMLSVPVISRIINYLNRKAIAKGWYKVALPRRGRYNECISCSDPAIRGDIDKACRAVRKEFTDVTMEKFDQGAQFPLAYFLQSIFFNPSKKDKEELKPFLDVEKDNASKIEIPTLAIWGLHDKTHRVTFSNDGSGMEAYAQYVKDGLFEMQVIKECAHFPELQFPDTFAKLLHDFTDKYKVMNKEFNTSNL